MCIRDRACVTCGAHLPAEAASPRSRSVSKKCSKRWTHLITCSPTYSSVPRIATVSSASSGHGSSSTVSMPPTTLTPVADQAKRSAGGGGVMGAQSL
eukprot:10513898-Prorocentrum_lima.AAC.1